MTCLSSAFTQDRSLHQLVASGGDREPRVLAGVQRLHDFLRANAPAHWRWTVIDGTGLGHTETPLATIPAGLRFVFDKSVWEIPPPLADGITEGRTNPERAIASFYAALSARIGSPVPASLKWMLAAAHTKCCCSEVW